MSVTVTLHVFSGRPDPSWELDSEEISQLVAQLRSINTTTLSKPLSVAGGLGYRGFSIESNRERDLDPHTIVFADIIDRNRFSLNLQDANRSVERWLLSSATGRVDPAVLQHVNAQMGGTASAASLRGGTTSLSTPPPYNPGKWNNDPNILHRNNCYNYGCDLITNTFAQPGRGTGTQYSAMDCANVGSGAQRDGLRSVPNTASTPANGHYVALVIWPGADFHWYRKDANNMWSHKPGQTPARNVDNSNQPISDPQNCNRGPYTQFCEYFNVDPATIHIL